MNLSLRSSLATLVLLAAPLTVLAQSASTPGGDTMGQGSQELHQQMVSGMQGMQSMKTMGDTDKDFAMMMKMHHQQALEMAQTELKHGKSKEMKAMAQKIIAAQRKEIAEFDKWLAANK